MKSNNNNASSCNPFIGVYANTDVYNYIIKIEPKPKVEDLELRFKALKSAISSLPLKGIAKSSAKKVIFPDSIIKKVFSYLPLEKFKEIAKICKDYKNYVLKCFGYQKTYEAYKICTKINEVQKIISKLNDQELFDQEVFSRGQSTLQKIIESLILAKAPKASTAKHIQMHAATIIYKIKYDMRNSKDAPAEVFWKYFCQKLDDEHRVEWGILSKDLKVGRIAKFHSSFGYSGDHSRQIGEDYNKDIYAQFLKYSTQSLQNTIDIFNTYFLNQVDLDIEELVKIILSPAYSASNLAQPHAYSASNLKQLPEDLQNFFDIFLQTSCGFSFGYSYLIYNHVDIQSRLAKHPDLRHIVEDSSDEFALYAKIARIDNYEDDKDARDMFIKIGDVIISHFADTLLKQFDDLALPLKLAPSHNEISKALDEIKNSTFSAEILDKKVQDDIAHELASKNSRWNLREKNTEFHSSVKNLREKNLAQEPPLHKWVKTTLSKMYINAEIYYVDLINEAIRSNDFDYKDELLSLKVVSYILSETKENKSVPYALLAKILTILPYSDIKKVEELILDSFSNICAAKGYLYEEKEFDQIKQEICKYLIGSSECYFYDYQ
jgi:hypothetical protein